MNKLIFTIIFFIIANVILFPQRNRTPDGRGSESGIKQRIDRIEDYDRNPKTRNPQRTIVHQQHLREKTNPHIKENIHIAKNYNPPCRIDRIENHPDKYSFPDRIYLILNIEPILQCFYIEDFVGAIELLTQAIEENPFTPEFYFLRGVAYINRKSDSKKSDYWTAENDFSMVKTLDPNFPGLKYYLDLLDFYIWGRKHKPPITTRNFIH